MLLREHLLRNDFRMGIIRRNHRLVTASWQLVLEKLFAFVLCRFALFATALHRRLDEEFPAAIRLLLNQWRLFHHLLVLHAFVYCALFVLAFWIGLLIYIFITNDILVVFRFLLFFRLWLDVRLLNWVFVVLGHEFVQSEVSLGRRLLLFLLFELFTFLFFTF